MAGYVPGAIPRDCPPGIKSFLELELRRLSIALNAQLRVPISGAEPERYQNGDVVYADGVTWDPGSGEGFYGREAGAWVKL